MKKRIEVLGGEIGRVRLGRWGWVVGYCIGVY